MLPGRGCRTARGHGGPAARRAYPTADEGDAREVELHDRGVSHVAPDAGPGAGAGRHGRLLAQRALVRRACEERLQR